MRLTSREKIMLCFLGIVAVLALCYFFLFKPQSDKIAELTAQDLESRQKVTQIRAELAAGEKLDAEIKALDADIAKKTQNYYPEILEDKILVTLDDLVKKSQVKPGLGAFANISIEKIAGPAGEDKGKAKEATAFPLRDLTDKYKSPMDTVVQVSVQEDAGTAPAAKEDKSAPAAKADEKPVDMVENMVASLDFTGTNDQFMSFIKELEALNRSVVISGLNIEAGDNNILKVKVSITFYALPKIQEQDKEYFEWPYNGTYGKTNPYKAPVVKKPTSVGTSGGNGVGGGGSGRTTGGGGNGGGGAGGGTGGGAGELSDELFNSLVR